jgi:esterase/lipase superfamily enzyme
VLLGILGGGSLDHRADWGTPVLVFPTAGGDPEEIERMGLIGALEPLLTAGRIKIYSLDSIAGRAWLMRLDPRQCTWLQNQYDAFVYQ